MTLSRRAVLRGLAGATVSLPLLDAMLDSRGEALADGTPLPKRFVTFHFGDGVILDRWVPAAIGAAWELTPQLAPLAPVKSACSILSGFGIDASLGAPHHLGMSWMWSATAPMFDASMSTFGGKSIDQVAADALGPGTRGSSIEIGVSKRVAPDGGLTLKYLSHRGSLQPMPPVYDPRALWERLFGVPPPGSAPDAVRGGVLGAVADDARRLRARVGAADQHRLDAHLAAIEALQAQVLAVPPPPPPTCDEAPPQPTESNSNVNGVEPMQAVADVMNALLVHAFSCDVARVASILLTGPCNRSVYTHLGQNLEQHEMTHDPAPNLEAIHDGIVWNMQQLSNLLQALAAVPQGGAGTLLDQSIVLAGSDVAEGWTHSTADMPVVIAGGGGGALVTGIHVRATGGNLSDVLLTALHAASASITSVGSGAGMSSSLVPEMST